VLSYLAIAVRLPERVQCPTMFMELAILLLLVDFERPRIKLRSALFGSFVIGLISAILLIKSVYSIYTYGQYSDRRQQSTVEALNYLSTVDSPIIVNTTSVSLADQTYLWQDFPQLEKIRILHLFWFQSPIYDQRAKHLGINDVFSDLAHRPDMVFAVTRWDLHQVTALETFLHEHKGISVKFEVAKIPGTDKDATFPFFSLFKAKIDSGS